MTTDTELFSKASKAAHDYRTVYGSFPDKIGIHHERLQSFPHRYIVFPERIELPMEIMLAEPPPSFESIRFRQHVAMFEPVIGRAVERDEVYLPIPGDEMGTTTGTSLAFIAQQKEREAKYRYHREGKHQDIHRIMQAEQEEEGDVCRDCYRFYLPMRKLQEIYPDWPSSVVPQCDYCEKLAKYHVKRSDWITFEKAEAEK